MRDDEQPGHSSSLTWAVASGQDVAVEQAASSRGANRRSRSLLIGIGACALTVVVVYLAMVSTAWGHQFDNDAYFGRSVVGRRFVTTEGDLLGHVTAAVLLIALIALVVISAVRRIVAVGVIAAGSVIAALVGVEVLKRTLPWHELVASDSLLHASLQRDTYPSGHTTIGTSLALAALLICPARWRWWAAVAAGIFVVAFATGVVFAGWHRPSDAIGGICWSGVVVGAAALVAMRAIPTSQGAAETPDTENRRSRWLSVTAATVVYVGIISLAVVAKDDLPDADRPFVIAAAVIVATAFAVPSWFATSLSGVDWAPASGRSSGSLEVLQAQRRIPGDTSDTPTPSQ